MICPYCHHDNIPGEDLCGNCGQDLTAYDQPQGSSPFEANIMDAALEELGARKPVMVAPETPLSDVVATLGQRRIGCVLVGRQGELLGIFSERDALMRVADRYAELASHPISEFMTREPETLEVSDPIAFALNRMSLGDFRHIPLTRDGKLESIVSLRDVLGLLSTWVPDLIPPRQQPAE